MLQQQQQQLLLHRTNRNIVSRNTALLYGAPSLAIPVFLAWRVVVSPFPELVHPLACLLLHLSRGRPWWCKKKVRITWVVKKKARIEWGSRGVLYRIVDHLPLRNIKQNCQSNSHFIRMFRVPCLSTRKKRGCSPGFQHTFSIHACLHVTQGRPKEGKKNRRASIPRHHG